MSGRVGAVEGVSPVGYGGRSPLPAWVEGERSGGWDGERREKHKDEW
jgi:hypothetical protein